MSIPIRVMIEGDAQILLERALLGNKVCAFGEDGGGKHGQSQWGAFFKVNSLDVNVLVDDDDDPEEISATVLINLDDYDSADVGHICTDKNFDMSVNALLKEEDILPDILTWPDDLAVQGRHSVVLDLDLGELLGW